jgi:hypothetical protein
MSEGKVKNWQTYHAVSLKTGSLASIAPRLSLSTSQCLHALFSSTSTQFSEYFHVRRIWTKSYHIYKQTNKYSTFLRNCKQQENKSYSSIYSSATFYSSPIFNHNSYTINNVILNPASTHYMAYSFYI